MSTLICDICQQPLRTGTKHLFCGTPNCSRLAHSARRCSCLSARQGRWTCRQHRQSNRFSETVAGRPAAQIQQQAPSSPLRELQKHLHLQYRASRLQQLSPPSQETAGSADVVQRLRHNFVRDWCRQARLSASQPTESANQPSVSSNKSSRVLYQGPRGSTTVTAGEN